MAQKDFYTFYRWHLPDPYCLAERGENHDPADDVVAEDGLLEETHNDWSCATFWYEPTPSDRCRRCRT